MSHACELCGMELGARDKVCRVCGQKIGEAESSKVRAANTGTSASAPPGTAPDTLFVMPQPLAQRRNRQGFAWTIGGCVTSAAIVGVACWMASAVWMRGPGGEVAFQQYNRAGNVAFERGDFNAADTEYSEMIVLRPNRVEGYLLRAINDYKEGRMPQAIRDNTSALALTSVTMQRASLYFNRAEAYNERSAWDKAVADFTASEQAYLQANAEPGGYVQDQERVPDWMADVRHGRARANLQLKNYAQTIADYDANIKAGTIRPEDYGMRGTAEEKLGHEAEAIADYGKSICIDPGYLYGDQALDLLVTKSRRYEQAVTAFRQATEAHPDNVLFQGSLGWYEYMAGHLPTAIATDERALSLDPTQVWIDYNLGLCYAVAGDSARSSKAYADGLAGQNQANRAEAFKEIQQALNQHPGSAALQAALKQMETAIAKDPHVPATPTQGALAIAPRVDPAFESLLAADTKRRGYAIRPPTGYTFKQTTSASLSGTHNVDYWRGPAHPDGSAPDLQVEVITDDGRIAAHSSPQQLLQHYLDELSNNHAQLKTSAITPCTMGMRTFMKVTWSGVGVKTSKPFNGVAYIASQTGEYISIVAHDSVPYSTTSLPLLEASVRTFRK